MFSFPSEERGVVRLQENFERSVILAGGVTAASSRSERRGVSALFTSGGKRGFACSGNDSGEGIRDALDKAYANLRALTPNAVPIQRDERSFAFVYPCADPDQAALSALAAEVDREILRLCPGLAGRTVKVQSEKTDRRIFVSNGMSGVFSIPRTNIFITLRAENRKGRMISVNGSVGGMGFAGEVFPELSAVTGLISGLYEDLMQKRSPVFVEGGEWDCIMADCTGLLIHEAFGHAAEGDAVAARSALAGRCGERLVSPLISATDFASSAFGGPVPQPLLLDDEGTVSRDAPLIREGVLVGYMTDLATADKLGVTSTGSARAAGFSDLPLVRMRNTAIHPGSSALEEMLSSMERGIYIKRTGGGQADMTGKFMFSVCCAYLVENGRLTGALPDLVCHGSSFRTLGGVTMVGNSVNWRFSSACGKGGQTIPVGMCGPALRAPASISIGG